MFRALLWMIVGAVITLPVAFMWGVNVERSVEPVCYAVTEDSDKVGCEYDGKHNVWVRTPAGFDEILSGSRR